MMRVLLDYKPAVTWYDMHKMDKPLKDKFGKGCSLSRIRTSKLGSSTKRVFHKPLTRQ